MRTLFFALICTVICYSVKAQEIDFPYSNAQVSIDGVLNASEWANADHIWIPVSGTDSVQVRFQHDSSALYFVFSGKLESANALFPEILLDPQDLTGNSWSSGQWWFHVSATDCENNGAYGVYNDCKLVQPGWEAVPNMSSGPPSVDTIEIRIPFSKIGLNLSTGKIGIAFVVTNTATVFKLWPQTADRNAPATWAGAGFSTSTAIHSEVEISEPLQVYPNPVTDKVTICNTHSGSRLSISDMSGKVIFQKIASSPVETLSLGNFPSGFYLLHVKETAGADRSLKLLKLVN